MEGTLTVYFDEPFWVGIFERCDNGRLSVCKVTFGAEPKEQEIYEFALKHFTELRFSQEVDIKQRKKHMPGLLTRIGIRVKTKNDRPKKSILRRG